MGTLSIKDFLTDKKPDKRRKDVYYNELKDEIILLKQGSMGCSIFAFFSGYKYIGPYGRE